ncbi:MAG: thiamine-phosphate kinase [Thermoproteota archaeon]
MRLRDVGEHRVVRKLLEKVLSRSWRCRKLQPGDDAACAGPSLSKVLVKIDGFSLAGVKAPWMTWYDVGWQAVAAAASDIVAKGGRPLAFLISVGLSGDEDEEVLLELVQGASDSALRHGAWLAGGDTNSCPQQGCGWIDAAGVGVAEKPVGRSPKPGDLVYTTLGRHGVGGAVLRALETGLWRTYFELFPSLFSEFARPLARLAFADVVGAVAEGCITGSADSSDGLAYTLKLVAEAAGASVFLEKLPRASSDAEKLAERLGASIEELVLYGGQEYEVIFTVRPSCAEEVESAARRAGLSVERIGVIRHGPPNILLNGKVVEGRGWDNFKK